MGSALVRSARVGSSRAAALLLGLGCLALGIGLLSQPDPEGPKLAVRGFLAALARGDHVAASEFVAGRGKLSKVEREAPWNGEQRVEFDPARVRLDLLQLTGNESLVTATLSLGDREIVLPIELSRSRGVGWKIRSIYGQRVDPLTLWSEIQQGVIDADPHYADDLGLKRELEKAFAAPGEKLQIARDPESREGEPRQF